MEEENNNKEQNVENVENAIKDTADMVKNGANLAKNVGTGNYLGAIKDAFGLLKNKKFRMKLIISTITPFIVIVLLASFLLGIFNSVGTAFQNAFYSVEDLFTIDKTDGAIVIKDEYIDKIINAISELGIDISGLKLMGDVDYTNADIQEENKKALRKYIKEFCEAQLMTETLNTKPNWVEEHILNGGKVYGTVYVCRENGDGKFDPKGETQLKYMEYDKLVEKVEKAKSSNRIPNDIYEKFSINNGKLVYVTTSESTTNNSDGTSSKSTNVILKEMDYKDEISQYTTPANFLLYLTLITQNPEFVSAVTDLIKNSEIRIMLLDTITETTTTKTHNYTLNTKTVEKVETGNVTYDSWDTEQKYPVNIYTFDTTHVTSTPKTDITTTTTTSVSTSLRVTYVKTWFCEQTITYKKVNDTITNTGSTENLEDELEPQALREGTYSWKTNQTIQMTSTTNTTKYEEDVRGDVESRLGEKGSPGLDKNGNGKVDNNEKVTEDTRFLGLLDDKFKIPNSTRYDSAAGNLISGAEMFFYLLKNDASLQNLEQIMRYALYLYTGKDYGVTEFDFSIFDARDFEPVSDVHSLSNYLLQFSHGTGAPKSADGQYYLLYGDGVGWPTIGNADLQWKSNQGRFAVPGKVLENGIEKEVANVQEYVNSKLPRGGDEQYTNEEILSYQIYIETTLVDQVGEQIQQAIYNFAISETNGLDLSRQQLYALTAIIYNFGHLPKRNGYTFREVYQAGEEKYEANSWEHNKFIWDNWWNALGGGAAGHIPARDAAFETYVKGILDFSVSDAGEVFGRKYYIYYTASQLAQFPYAPNKPIKRTQENEEDIFTMVVMAGEFTPAKEKYITGYYTSTTGRKFTILNQTIIGYEDRDYWRLDDPPDGPGWAGRCNRAASAIIASGYSDQDANELITTMNKMYDAEIPSDKYWNLYGLKRTEYKGGFVSSEKFVEIIRNQLTKGGYITVWVNSNNNGYYGKSGMRWTQNIHWMAIIDYKIEDGEEKIAIADGRGVDWYDIDEYIHGINAYALISEK